MIRHHSAGQSINWPEIYEQLDRLRHALETDWAPSAEETRNILRKRAEALASRPSLPAMEEAIAVVEFVLATERYAIESFQAREVCPLRQVASLPGAPAFVLGVMNLRGELLSVIDLRKFFDLPERGLTDLSKVIRVGAGGIELGILADQIVGLTTIVMSEMQEPPLTLTGIRSTFLKGIAKDRLIVLDVTRILTDKSFAVYETLEP